MKDLVSSAYVVKTHGYRGHLRIRLLDGVGLIGDIPPVFYLDVKGEVLPYFVESAEMMKEGELRIKFEDLDSKEDAAHLKGSTVLLEATFVRTIQQEDLPIHLTGYSVVDVRFGKLGTVREVVAYPMQEMLSIRGDYGEVLIPLKGELIDHIDEDQKRITTNLPDGYLEIN